MDTYLKSNAFHSTRRFCCELLSERVELVVWEEDSDVNCFQKLGVRDLSSLAPKNLTLTNLSCILFVTVAPTPLNDAHFRGSFI